MGLSKQDKINVLMFGPGVKGGITGVVEDWAEAGITDRINMEYISTLEDSDSNKLTKLKDAIYACVKLLSKALKDIDLVHIHLAGNMSFYRKLVIFMLAKLLSAKLIVHLHGSVFKDFYNSGGVVRKKLIRFMFSKADAMIVLSEGWKTFVSSISTNKSIYILYNGASTQKFHLSVKKDENEIKILFMGRLGDRKGVYDLLEAFSLLIEKVPCAILLLGGDGEIDKVNKIISQMNLSERIKVLGWVAGNDKIKLYEKADIYTLPSYNEGLPVSILEAMASGLPVVSTPVGGISEAVIEGVNGYLVQPGDVESLYKRLMSLCQSAELRTSMGKESRELIEEKFDIQKLVSQLMDIYTTTLAT